MNTTNDAVAHVMRLIKDEYTEMPGQSLTMPQMQRLYNLYDTTCAVAVNQHVADGFLARRGRQYIRF